MEEKKMTDEELIKAVENCLYGDYKTKCKDCPYDNSEGYCQDMDRALLSLIYNQNAEIERLKKRHGVALLRNDDLDLENYELKKQVDELKADITKAVEDYKKEMPKAMEEAEKLFEERIQQAVKDTAKEICKAIHEDLQADLFNLKHSIFDTERQKAQEQQNIGILSAQDTVSRFEKKIKERYGVEVE